MVQNNHFQPGLKRSSKNIKNHCHEKSGKGIAAIIFCEFDVLRGPVLQHQYPENCVTKETFEALSVYLIPKPELYGKLITINAFGLKILGYPVCIRDAEKYKRNQLIFNLCFVFDNYTSTTQYEPIIQKLAHYLIDLEGEMEFISEKRAETKLPEYLATIRDHLNLYEVCTIRLSMSTTIHLKLTKVQPNPRVVEDYHVPVILKPDYFSAGCISAWDLTTQQLYYYIDGVNHVSKIAFLADVDVNLVKACIQNLIYYGLVTLVPIFLYCNVYVTTPVIRTLIEDAQLQSECLRAIRKPASHAEPTIKKVLQVYSHMYPGMTVRDLCQRFNLHASGIDEQRLIKFGLLKGIIRRVQKYPILLNDQDVATAAIGWQPASPTQQHLSPRSMASGNQSPLGSPSAGSHMATARNNIYAWFDGKHSYDQLCCELNKTHREIEEKVEKNPAVVVCWK